MSVTNPVIDVSELSKEVVQDLLRSGLQAFADESSSLNDPLSPRENKQAPFVLTSYPDIGVSYPHLVVRETNIELAPIDRTQNVWSGPFSAGIEIIATNATEKFQLKDGVRAFVVKEYAADTFTNAGYHDVSIDSTDAIDWDDTTETESLEVSISGEVYVN